MINAMVIVAVTRAAAHAHTIPHGINCAPDRSVCHSHQARVTRPKPTKAPASTMNKTTHTRNASQNTLGAALLLLVFEVTGSSIDSPLLKNGNQMDGIIIHLYSKLNDAGSTPYQSPHQLSHIQRTLLRSSKNLDQYPSRF